MSPYSTIQSLGAPVGQQEFCPASRSSRPGVSRSPSDAKSPLRPAGSRLQLRDRRQRAAASNELRGLLGANLGFETSSRFQHIDADRSIRMVLDARR